VTFDPARNVPPRPTYLERGVALEMTNLVTKFHRSIFCFDSLYFQCEEEILRLHPRRSSI